ncbi:L-ascorbate oxidase-like protein, partial [Drosera capensis]
MTVVKADGANVEPFEAKNLFIYSGETYSVLITANQDPSRNYWITTNVVSRKPGTSTGLAILNYYPNHPQRSPTTVPTTGPPWNDTAPRLAQSLSIKARQGFVDPPPTTADRTIVFLNTQNKINGYIHWSMNNVSFSLPSTPYLAALKERLHHVFRQNSPPNGYDFKDYDIFSVAKNVN